MTEWKSFLEDSACQRAMGLAGWRPEFFDHPRAAQPGQPLPRPVSQVRSADIPDAVSPQELGDARAGSTQPEYAHVADRYV